MIAKRNPKQNVVRVRIHVRGLAAASVLPVAIHQHAVEAVVGRGGPLFSRCGGEWGMRREHEPHQRIFVPRGSTIAPHVVEVQKW